MQLYAGLDLHSRNTYIGIMDKKFKRIFAKLVANKLQLIEMCQPNRPPAVNF